MWSLQNQKASREKELCESEVYENLVTQSWQIIQCMGNRWTINTFWCNLKTTELARPQSLQLFSPILGRSENTDCRGRMTEMYQLNLVIIIKKIFVCLLHSQILITFVHPRLKHCWAACNSFTHRRMNESQFRLIKSIHFFQADYVEPNCNGKQVNALLFWFFLVYLVYRTGIRTRDLSIMSLFHYQ